MLHGHPWLNPVLLNREPGRGVNRQVGPQPPDDGGDLPILVAEEREEARGLGHHEEQDASEREGDRAAEQERALPTEADDERGGQDAAERRAERVSNEQDAYPEGAAMLGRIFDPERHRRGDRAAESEARDKA